MIRAADEQVPARGPPAGEQQEARTPLVPTSTGGGYKAQRDSFSGDHSTYAETLLHGTGWRPGRERAASCFGMRDRGEAGGLRRSKGLKPHGLGGNQAPCRLRPPRAQRGGGTSAVTGRNGLRVRGRHEERTAAEPMGPAHGSGCGLPLVVVGRDQQPMSPPWGRSGDVSCVGSGFESVAASLMAWTNQRAPTSRALTNRRPPRRGWGEGI